MAEKFKHYAVFLRAREGAGSWLYTQLAEDPKTAWIQARLRHLGEGRPEVKQAFDSRDVREV